MIIAGGSHLLIYVCSTVSAVQSPSLNFHLPRQTLEKVLNVSIKHSFELENVSTYDNNVSTYDNEKCKLKIELF